MNRTTFKSVPIKQLYTHLDGGSFAMSKLQRAFVWNGNKAANLLDSIYRGMPIGSVTVWDTGQKNRNMLRQSLHIHLARLARRSRCFSRCIRALTKAVDLSVRFHNARQIRKRKRTRYPAPLATLI